MRGLNQAAAHRIAELLPLLIRTNPSSLVLQIGEGFLQGLQRLGELPIGKLVQSAQRLIDASKPEPSAMQVHLIVALALGKPLTPCPMMRRFGCAPELGQKRCDLLAFCTVEILANGLMTFSCLHDTLGTRMPIHFYVQDYLS